MKKIPDILSQEQWIALFEPWELINLETEIDVDVDSYTKCPSCDGSGYISLSHTFSDEHGKWRSHDYDVDCEYCDSDGEITLDGSQIVTNKLATIYAYQVKKELEKYTTYYNLIHPENR